MSGVKLLHFLKKLIEIRSNRPILNYGFKCSLYIFCSFSFRVYSIHSILFLSSSAFFLCDLSLR